MKQIIKDKEFNKQRILGITEWLIEKAIMFDKKEYSMLSSAHYFLKVSRNRAYRADIKDVNKRILLDTLLKRKDKKAKYFKLSREIDQFILEVLDHIGIFINKDSLVKDLMAFKMSVLTDKVDIKNSTIIKGGLISTTVIFIDTKKVARRAKRKDRNKIYYSLLEKYDKLRKERAKSIKLVNEVEEVTKEDDVYRGKLFGLSYSNMLSLKKYEYLYLS